MPSAVCLPALQRPWTPLLSTPTSSRPARCTRTSVFLMCAASQCAVCGCDAGPERGGESGALRGGAGAGVAPGLHVQSSSAASFGLGRCWSPVLSSSRARRGPDDAECACAEARTVFRQSLRRTSPRLRARLHLPEVMAASRRMISRNPGCRRSMLASRRCWPPAGRRRGRGRLKAPRCFSKQWKRCRRW